MSESIKFRSAVNGFNRNEVIAYIENLLKEKNRLLQENEKLKAECKAKSDDAENARRELVDEKRKCDGCNIARKAEEKLGATMFEAKRFSDTLINEASKRTSSVFEAASVKASAAVSSAVQISDALKKCSESMENAAVAVDEIKAMLGSFDVFLSEKTDKNAETDSADDSEPMVKSEEQAQSETNNAEKAAADVKDEESDTAVKAEKADAVDTAGNAGKSSDISDDEMSEIFKLPVGSPEFTSAFMKLLSEDDDDSTKPGAKKSGGFTPDFGFDDEITVNVELDG